MNGICPADRRRPEQALAKMASDMQKPSGFTVLRIREVPKLLWHRPCEALFGIGRKTAEKLKKVNIRTIGQLAAAEETLLVRQFGVMGSWMKAAAHGIDHSPVNPARDRNKSVRPYDNAPAGCNRQRKRRTVYFSIWPIRRAGGCAVRTGRGNGSNRHRSA